ncbi:hypothetical protein G9A89_007278 [Geosiphon pyriformis]|nr:hypothetical protein G9A89_007278 [Geosiphon pyriformis]
MSDLEIRNVYTNRSPKRSLSKRLLYGKNALRATVLYFELYNPDHTRATVKSDPIIMNTKKAIFQEDKVPTHKYKLVKELHDNLGIVTLEWPPQSPDLSPIENMWKKVKYQIHQNRKAPIPSFTDSSKKNDSVISLEIKNRIADQRITGKAPQVRDYQKWTVEEKTALIEFRRQNGLSWKIIAEKYFPDRTADAIRVQYYSLKKQ